MYNSNLGHNVTGQNAFLSSGFCFLRIPYYARAEADTGEILP